MSRRPISLACLVSTLITVGCTEPDLADLVIEPQSEPFYWYQDTTRIYLRIDPASLTVETDSDALPALSASLAAFRVTVDSTTAMAVAPGHWILWLHPGTSATAAAAGAHELRLHATVRFASNAYLYGEPPDECTLWLVNRLVVMYRASTTSEQIAALQQRAGFEVEEAPSGVGSPVWVLRYPTGSRYTPLEIAAAVYHHPFVDWASADMVGCVQMWAGGV
jgi:hypothetical protein